MTSLHTFSEIFRAKTANFYFITIVIQFSRNAMPVWFGVVKKCRNYNNTDADVSHFVTFVYLYGQL